MHATWQQAAHDALSCVHSHSMYAWALFSVGSAKDALSDQVSQLQAAMTLLQQLAPLAEASNTNAIEGILPFVQKLLNKDMDKQQAAKLIQVWLGASGLSPLKTWQTLLGGCTETQVQCILKPDCLTRA